MNYYHSKPDLYKRFKPRNLLITGNIYKKESVYNDFKFDYIGDLYEGKSIIANINPPVLK